MGSAILLAGAGALSHGAALQVTALAVGLIAAAAAIRWPALLPVGVRGRRHRVPSR